MSLAFLRYTPIVEWQLGPLAISPHGLGTAIGFLAGARLLLSTTRRLSVADQLVCEALTRGALGAVIGARIAYVITRRRTPGRKVDEPKRVPLESQQGAAP